MNDSSIKAYFGGDTTQLQAAINSAHAMTGKFAKDSAAVFEEVGNAEKSLADFRKQADLQHGAGYRKEIILQREIIELKKAAAAIEGQSTEKLNIQLAIEQKALELERMITRELGEQQALSRRGASSGAGGASEEAEKTAGALEHANKQLRTMFSLGHAVKGVFAFFALSNIDKVAEAIARGISGVSKEEEDALKELDDVSTKSADKAIDAMHARLSEEQKLQLLLTERERLAKKISSTEVKSTADLVALKKDEIALAEKEMAINELAGSINEKKFDSENQMRQWLQQAHEADAEFQKKDLEEKSKDAEKYYRDYMQLEQRKREFAREGMTIDEQKIALVKEEAETKKKLAKLDSDSPEGIKLQNKLLDVQKSLRDVNKDLASQALETEKKLTEEKEKQDKIQAEINEKTQKAVDNAQSGLALAGIRGEQLSSADDATLAEILRRNNAQKANLSANQGSAFEYGNSLDLRRIENENNRIAAEQKFRSGFRSALDTGGVEAARRMFQGNPLEFDRVLKQFTSGVDNSDKLLTTLEKTNNILTGKFANQ
jgi:hypothetical protein